jgi:NTE family protein
MKTVIAFQGGGALGAFAAGAWDVLARSPLLGRSEIVAVAGASIGAITAATIAHGRSEEDLGAGGLLALWREQLQTPAWPYLGPVPLSLPPSGATIDHWNGFMTGLLLGNRGMHRASWPAWQPLSGLWRLHQPLHERGRMHALLEDIFPPYASEPGDAPMLAVGSVDLMSGRLSLFDSDSAPVEPRHLAASSAIPLVFEPVSIEGRLHWDGEITRDSLLPLLFARLRETGRVKAGEPVRLVSIEVFTREIAAVPETGVELSFRAISLLQLDKLAPPPDAGVEVAQWLRIGRDPLPEDGVSGQFDYSPRRIERLIEQGRDAARRALGVDADQEAGALTCPTS